MSHVVVTGGNGYIGRRLIQLLRERGIRVTALGRHRPLAGGCGFVSWELGRPVPPGSLDGVDAVIHLAHAWKSDRPEEQDPNLAGGLALLAESRAAGVGRFVLGSTVSARADALNRYGRVKYRLQESLAAPSEVAARIGLVYGGPALSQWGTMIRLCRLPVLPMLDPGTLVQPIHVDEVCDGLIRLAGGALAGQPVVALCGPEPLAWGDFLRTLARVRHGGRLRLLPVSSGLALPLVDLAARLPLLPRIDRERILGLKGLTVVDAAADLKALGLSPMALDQGMRPPAWQRRRDLVDEAAVLLRAVSGRPPTGSKLRRYVRGVEAFEGGQPLGLPPLTRRLPTLLRAFEPVGGANPRAGRRLALALRVAETSPDGLGPAPSLPGLMATLAVEGLLLPLRLILGRLW